MSRGNSRDRGGSMGRTGLPDDGPELAGEKSARSVFVGNIPYEATEEKLKDIFSEVGMVVSFKLVYDRENGKPRGYGFCEYQNPETAVCAMRNLNGYEIGGRTLRVDSACTEKSRMEMQQVMTGPSGAQGGGPVSLGGVGGPIDGGPFGDSMDPEKAPEAISKAVASLPPEQMFELMKQMKMCIQNNPTEARNMLLANPQLAYALLQAQVVMRIVKPETALQMLHKNHNPPLNIGTRGDVRGPGPAPAPLMPDRDFGGRGGRPFDDRSSYERDMDRDRGSGGGSRYDDRRDPRSRDPRASRDPRGDRDLRGGFGGPPRRDSGGPPVNPPTTIPPHLISNDPERNNLIMQVLQLTDEQISMLPGEQRMSIMELKKQINAHGN